MRPSDADIREAVRGALAEDVGHGDVTTACLDRRDAPVRGRIVAREALVLAGVRVAELTFAELDPEVRFTARARDGERLAAGASAAVVEGRAAAVLAAERTALNFLQRMCGIATAAARAVGEVDGTGARILDTRKTVPGLRRLDKYAARAGGAANHRFGLYDGILLKDNHLALAGGVVAAVEQARRSRPQPLLRIEVEVESPADAEAAVAAGADALLLDNMELDAVRETVRRVGGRVPLEVSGGLRPGDLRALAETGVQFLSLGWLTHSQPAADLSLELEPSRGSDRDR